MINVFEINWDGLNLETFSSHGDDEINEVMEIVMHGETLFQIIFSHDNGESSVTVEKLDVPDDFRSSSQSSVWVEKRNE